MNWVLSDPPNDFYHPDTGDSRDFTGKIMKIGQFGVHVLLRSSDFVNIVMFCDMPTIWTNTEVHYIIVMSP